MLPSKLPAGRPWIASMLLDQTMRSEAMSQAHTPMSPLSSAMQINSGLGKKRRAEPSSAADEPGADVPLLSPTASSVRDLVSFIEASVIRLLSSGAWRILCRGNAGAQSIICGCRGDGGQAQRACGIAAASSGALSVKAEGRQRSGPGPDCGLESRVGPQADNRLHAAGDG